MLAKTTKSYIVIYLLYYEPIQKIQVQSRKFAKDTQPIDETSKIRPRLKTNYRKYIIMEYKMGTEGYSETDEWKNKFDLYQEGEIKQLPKNFWKNKSQEKAKTLLRYHAKQNDLQKDDILSMPNRDLILDAGLRTPLAKFYDGSSVDFLLDTFDELEEKDFRWTANRKIDLDKVKKFREDYCTISAIADYFGCTTEVIRSRANELNRDLDTPDDKSLIQAPVKETEYFWKQVEKAQKERISLEKMFENLEKQNNWSRSKISNLVNRYNIKEQAGRKGTNIGKRIKFENYNGRLYESEKFVSQKLDEKKLVVLDGYGADFIYKDNILIEAKKSLGTYNVPKALLQLVYAEDKLGKNYDKRIYAMNLGSLEGEESSYRSFTQFYDIELYYFSDKDDKFKKISMKGDKFK